MRLAALSLALGCVACGAPSMGSDELGMPDLADHDGAPDDLSVGDLAITDLTVADLTTRDLSTPDLTTFDLLLADLFDPTVTVTVSSSQTNFSSLGDTAQYTAVAKDGSGGTVAGEPLTWTSDDTNVATVSTSGLVTAQHDGSTLIHAKAANNVDGSLGVTVSQVVASVTVLPSPLVIANGKTGALTGTARDANANAVAGTSFTWMSADTMHAPVDTNGVVTGTLLAAFGVGPVSVTATASSHAGMSSVSVAVYKTWSFATSSGSGLQVDVTQNQYFIAANGDGVTHSIVLDTGGSTVIAPWSSGDSGASLVTLAPGSYPFHCGIHGASMKGTLTVH